MYLFAELFQALCPPCHKHQLASLLRKRNSTRCADTTARASDEHSSTGDVYAHRCVLDFSACRGTPLPLQERKALWQAMLRCCTVSWKLVEFVRAKSAPFCHVHKYASAWRQSLIMSQTQAGRVDPVRVMGLVTVN